MIGVEQGLAVIDLAVVVEDGVDHLVDLLLALCSVHTGNLGQEADVVVDERLAAHAELTAVGIQLALRQHFLFVGIRLEFAVLRNQQQVANAADQVVVAVGALEVTQSALAGKLLKGGRSVVVGVDDALVDGGVHDGGEGCRGVVECTGQLGVQVICAHTHEVGSALAGLAGQALNADVTQAHACKLAGAIRRGCGGVAAAGHKAVSCCCAELVGFIGGHLDAGAGRSTVLNHTVQNGGAHLVYGLAAGDVLGSIDVEVPAQGGDIGDTLALRGAGGFNLSLALCLRFSISLRAQGLDVVLQGVEFPGLVLGHVAACGAGGGQDGLLALQFLPQLLSLVHV